jgi:protein SCO1/2
MPGMKVSVLASMLAVTAFGFLGCQKNGDHTPGGTRADGFSTNVTAYEVRGVFQEFRKGGWAAIIEHEDIPGYMEAMTMMLDVKDTNELAGLTPGDAITFRMLVTDSDGWIDRVKKTGRSTVSLTNAALPATADAPELLPGALLPDCTLTNQDGRSIRLSDFKGQAIAFTFFFTRCPFPVYCPRMSANFAAVQRELLANAPSTDWHLVSISFDPEFDKPPVLRSYGQGYGQQPAHWTFATGRADEIRKFGAGFGLMFRRTDTSIDHNIRTVVVDPAGKVHKVFYDNEWKPAELADEIRKAMKLP